MGAWIASVAFWVLLGYGSFFGEIDRKRLVIFVSLWIAGRVVLAFLPSAAASYLFTSYVAVLDIVLVFLIFEGDVRLS